MQPGLDQPRSPAGSMALWDALYLQGVKFSPVASELTETLEASLERLAIGRHRALDVGCGTGEFTECLSQALGFASVLGVDLSATAIESARSRVSDARFMVCHYMTTVFGTGQFDLISSRLSYGFMDDPAAFLRKVRSELSPDGVLYLATPVVLPAMTARDRYRSGAVDISETYRLLDETFPRRSVLREKEHDGRPYFVDLLMQP